MQEKPLLQLGDVIKVKSGTLDVYDFKNKVHLHNIINSQFNAGTYIVWIKISDKLPSNGYRLIMEIEEEDTVYKFEKDFLISYSKFDSSILNSAPNAISKNGSFEIKYENIPLGKKYIQTSEFEPTQIGTIQVTNTLRLIIYKPGFKIAQKDIKINPDEGEEIEIEMETE